MIDSIYYTPTIEEFHVGFEYERNDGSDWYNKVSNAYDMTDVSTMLNKQKEYEMYESHPKNIDLTESERDEKLKEIRLQKNVYCKRIRVKYLDREDIEAEGFKLTEESNGWLTFHKSRPEITVGDFDLEHSPSLHSVRIYVSGYRDDIIYFDGAIKNKSELRRILKMIGR